MIFAYFNYPNQLISAHMKNDCGDIQRTGKPRQRKVDIHSQNVDAELKRMENLKFASNADKNDMWVSVDLNDEALEWQVVTKIKEILGKRYKPFYNAKVNQHC